VGYRLTPDNSALQDALNSAAMEAQGRQAAERVMERAVEISPVGDPLEGDEHPGLYKRSWRVESGLNGGPTSRTAWGRVLNDTSYSPYVERGNSEGAPPQHILRRASEVLNEHA
jgi:hypothetical protein